MIQFLIAVFLAMALIAGAAILIAVAQGKRAKRAETESKALHEAFGEAARKAERLQQALGKQTEAEGKANAERKELAGAADADLARRANALFNGGMPDQSGSGGARGN
jgi:hypothetical protein